MDSRLNTYVVCAQAPKMIDHLLLSPVFSAEWFGEGYLVFVGYHN
jgi:hypothetical protein